MEDDRDDGDTKANELYYQSKLANVAFTRGFNLVAGSNADNMVDYKNAISCNCVNPGVVSTNIGRYANCFFFETIVTIDIINILVNVKECSTLFISFYLTEKRQRVRGLNY